VKACPVLGLRIPACCAREYLDFVTFGQTAQVDTGERRNSFLILSITVMVQVGAEQLEL
jgi:hypothetical protein